MRKTNGYVSLFALYGRVDTKMIQVIDTTYPFYRVGRRYFTRLSESRRWAKVTGEPVEKWIPLEQRGGDLEKCFVAVQAGKVVK